MKFIIPYITRQSLQNPSESLKGFIAQHSIPFWILRIHNHCLPVEGFIPPKPEFGLCKLGSQTPLESNAVLCMSFYTKAHIIFWNIPALTDWSRSGFIPHIPWIQKLLSIMPKQVPLSPKKEETLLVAGFTVKLEKCRRAGTAEEKLGMISWWIKGSMECFHSYLIQCISRLCEEAELKCYGTKLSIFPY